MQCLIDAETERTCRKCGQTKPIEEFGIHKQCKGGRTPTCRKCNYEKQKEWLTANKDHVRSRSNNKNRRRKLEVIEHFGDKCHDCGQSFPPCVYDFHHLDPTKKDVNPSYAMTRRPSEMWKELEKCVMLCSNCHRIRHHDKED